MCVLIYLADPSIRRQMLRCSLQGFKPSLQQAGKHLQRRRAARAHRHTGGGGVWLAGADRGWGTILEPPACAGSCSICTQPHSSRPAEGAGKPGQPKIVGTALAGASHICCRTLHETSA